MTDLQRVELPLGNLDGERHGVADVGPVIGVRRERLRGSRGDDLAALVRDDDLVAVGRRDAVTEGVERACQCVLLRRRLLDIRRARR